MHTGIIRSAEVSKSAIEHNLRLVQETTQSRVIAVMKANAYGHGVAGVAAAALAGGATALGVADLSEALELRRLGFTPDAADILCWLHGANADFGAAIRDRIELGVSHLDQLEAVAAAVRAEGDTPAVIQLKLDTGLSRNGAGCDEWEALFARAAELEAAGVVRVRGLFSHLANAGAAADAQQADRFDTAIAAARAHGLNPEMLHLAASAAALSGTVAGRYNTVRVGMAIYGLSPFAGVTAAELGLRPALRLTAEIVALRHVPAGTGVSYGYNYVTVTDTVLALIPVGYADGMPRALNNAGATVTVAGQQRPIVGRIGMDQCVVDLGNELGERVSLGDRVVLFGDPTRGEPPVEEWADRLHTINYEVVARLGTRISRLVVE